MEPSEEWAEYAKAHEHLSRKTMVTYQHTYKRLRNGLSKSLVKSGQKEIVTHAMATASTPNTEAQFINVATMIRRFYGAPTNYLDNARDRVRVRIDDRKAIVNAKKLDDLPSIEELKAHNAKLYTEEDWRGFIIGHLLFTFSTRNKDLDLRVIKDKADAKGKFNFLLLRPAGSISYIRRDYKTARMYGEKVNEFKSVKMKRAIEAFVESQGGWEKDVWLLSTSDGKRLGADSIQKFIRAKTHNGLCESDYNRIRVSAVDSVAGMSALKRISWNRGTELSTLLQCYHTSFPVSDDTKKEQCSSESEPESEESEMD